MSDINSYRDVEPDDIAALMALCTEYSWRVDHGYTDTVHELFADDGHWEAEGVPEPMIGKQALIVGWEKRASVGRQSLRRHLITNFRFSRDENGVVHGYHALIYFQAIIGEPTEPGVTMVGEYDDIYEKTAEGHWLFKRRRMKPVFPADWAPLPPK